MDRDDLLKKGRQKNPRDQTFLIAFRLFWAASFPLAVPPPHAKACSWSTLRCVHEQKLWGHNTEQLSNVCRSRIRTLRCVHAGRWIHRPMARPFAVWYACVLCVQFALFDASPEIARGTVGSIRVACTGLVFSWLEIGHWKQVYLRSMQSWPGQMSAICTQWENSKGLEDVVYPMLCSAQCQSTRLISFTAVLVEWEIFGW